MTCGCRVSGPAGTQGPPANDSLKTRVRGGGEPACQIGLLVLRVPRRVIWETCVRNSCSLLKTGEILRVLQNRKDTEGPSPAHTPSPLQSHTYT